MTLLQEQNVNDSRLRVSTTVDAEETLLDTFRPSLLLSCIVSQVRDVCLRWLAADLISGEIVSRGARSGKDL